MERDNLNQTIELRRKLARLKHRGLEGMSYVHSQIFKACETPDCGSYVCNLSTGVIQESHGLATVLGCSNRIETVEDIDHFTHPSDRNEIHDILNALYELGKEKMITSNDRLSCTYRIMSGKRYIQVHRKSGLAMNEITGEVVNWSNLYAMPNLPSSEKVLFHWSGSNFSNTDVKDYLNKHKEKLFTKKEISILNAWKEGSTTFEIANSLLISPKTVKKHFSNMFEKTGAKGRLQLLKFFERFSNDK